MKKTLVLSLVMISLLWSCKSPQLAHSGQQSKNENMLFATLYVQQASEYRALCYQAYNIGKLRLDAQLSQGHNTKTPAIVVDIDETVLDNSPFSARSIIEDSSYPTYWDEWCLKGTAEPIPGALDFLQYAASRGVEIFYISNRKAHLQAITLSNLQKHGFPNADTQHIMLRTTSSDKTERRSLVQQDYDILLFFGDNLGDFSPLFDSKDSETRQQLVKKMHAEWGERFIVLPNPTYGTWLNALRKKTKEGNTDLQHSLINF